MAPFPAPTKTWHTDTYLAIESSQPELSLTNKNVIITGGGAGLGAAIAKACAKAGASKLALLGRRADVLERTKRAIETAWPSTEVSVHVTDISKPEAVEASFQAIKRACHQPHILVNNAAHFGGPKAIIESDVDEWYRSFDVNVKGSALVTKAFLDIAVHNAVIINISSAIAHLSATEFPDFRGFSAYGASKLAVLRYFEWLQAENPNLHIVSVHPGQVMSTEMSQGVGGAEAPTIDTEELAADFVVWTMSAKAKFLRGRLAWANWDVKELEAAHGKIESENMFTASLDGWKQPL